MTSKQKTTIAGTSFEALKQTNEHGAEYWSARALQPLLGYSQWRRFEAAIERAISSCKESGNPPENHFAGAGKMIEIGKGGLRDVDDYQLSRFACYLIAQNGDHRKPEIAQAQQYFAIQTRRQELGDQLAADLERLNYANKRPTNSRHCRALPSRPVCRTACLVCFMMPATRGFTAAWAAMPSRPAKASPPKSS